MMMDGWVKCLSPQNTFGVSGVNRVAAKSNTIEEISELSSYVRKKQNKKTTCLNTIRLETRYFTPSFKHKCLLISSNEVHSGTVRNANIR